MSYSVTGTPISFDCFRFTLQLPAVTDIFPQYFLATLDTAIKSYYSNSITTFSFLCIV